MSETVDRIIDTHLKHRPGARHAYHHDPTMHNDIERARNMLAVVEAAMQREGIPYDSAERVLNEVVHAGLEGWERDKLNRERMLLLADMDPTEFRRPSSPVFTEPAGDFSVTDDLKPYAGPVRCTSVAGHNRRCEFPAGHHGLHENNEFFGLQWANLPGDPADVSPVRPDEEPT